MSPSLRDRAGRVARRVRAGAPQVSVVVEARGRESDVRAAIDSVRDQSERRLEILVVLVEEWLRPVAEEAARGDWRVRVLDALGADPAAVRRLGAEHAKGAHLLHLPPRQRLLPEPWTACSPIGRTTRPWSPGASLVGRTGALRRCWVACWSRGRPGSPSTTTGSPTGRGQPLRLLAGDHASTGLPTLVDDGPWRPRPFERPDDPRPRLTGRIAHDERMLASLPADERAAVAASLLARDLPPFLLAVERYDDEEWVRLQAHAARLVRLATTRLLDVPVEDRVLAWLAAEDRRDDLVAYVADRRFAGGAFPTRVRDGVIRAELGVRDVSDVVLEVSEAESPLRARVERVAGGRGRAVGRHRPARRGRPAGHRRTSTAASRRSSGPATLRSRAGWAEPYQCHDHGRRHAASAVPRRRRGDRGRGARSRGAPSGVGRGRPDRDQARGPQAGRPDRRRGRALPPAAAAAGATSRSPSPSTRGWSTSSRSWARRPPTTRARSRRPSSGSARTTCGCSGASATAPCRCRRAPSRCCSAAGRGTTRWRVRPGS